MFARTMMVPWIGCLVLVLALSAVAVKPAEASKTGNVLAGLAVGALVYSALDSADRSHYRPPTDYGPPAYPRYDPPASYSRYGYWDSPRQTYDRGYSDGWKDGYNYGKREGRAQGYDRGYGHGYSDGRHDQRVADRYTPAPRGGRYAQLAYIGW